MGSKKQASASSENIGEYENDEETTSESSDDGQAPAETSSETSRADGAESEGDGSASEKTSDEEAPESEGDGSASNEEAGAVINPEESRTGFILKGNPGDECTCPDGRKGTIHKSTTGLICIPVWEG